MLLAVVAGLFPCVLAAYCGIVAFERIRPVWREELGGSLVAAIGLPLTALAFLSIWTVESLSLDTGRFGQLLERLGRRLINALLITGGVFFLGFGLLIISDALSAGTMFTLVFGFGFIVIAFVALRRHRRWRQGLIDRGHPTTAVLYLPALPVLAAIGCLILALGL